MSIMTAFRCSSDALYPKQVRTTPLEPLASTDHRHPGESRGPGAARITQDNHAA